jgi:hypothetical protein
MKNENIKADRLVSLIKAAKNQYSDDYFVLAVPQFLAKKFLTYCSMQDDLKLVQEFIARLKTEGDKIVRSAFLYSIVSLYGKCFTDATNDKLPKLEPAVLFNGSVEHLETHEYLMNLRHHFISHRGETSNETVMAYILIPKDERTAEQSQIRFWQLKQLFFEAGMLEHIETSVAFILAFLKEQIEKSGQKAYNGYMNSFTPEQMTFMMLNNVEDNRSNKQ